jgi:predicted O-methyltransferase YrrM
LEVNSSYAEVAWKNILRAGLGRVVDIRVGPALSTLPTLKENWQSGFDLIFIDADKCNNATYFDWALKLTHVGSMIVAVNVVRAGEILHEDALDERVTCVRSGNAAMGKSQQVMATAVSNGGEQGT